MKKSGLLIAVLAVAALGWLAVDRTRQSESIDNMEGLVQAITHINKEWKIETMPAEEIQKPRQGFTLLSSDDQYRGTVFFYKDGEDKNASTIWHPPLQEKDSFYDLPFENQLDKALKLTGDLYGRPFKGGNLKQLILQRLKERTNQSNGLLTLQFRKGTDNIKVWLTPTTSDNSCDYQLKQIVIYSKTMGELFQKQLIKGALQSGEYKRISLKELVHSDSAKSTNSRYVVDGTLHNLRSIAPEDPLFDDKIFPLMYHYDNLRYATLESEGETLEVLLYADPSTPQELLEIRSHILDYKEHAGYFVLRVGSRVEEKP